MRRPGLWIAGVGLIFGVFWNQYESQAEVSVRFGFTVPVFVSPPEVFCDSTTTIVIRGVAQVVFHESCFTAYPVDVSFFSTCSVSHRGRIYYTHGCWGGRWHSYRHRHHSGWWHRNHDIWHKDHHPGGKHGRRLNDHRHGDKVDHGRLDDHGHDGKAGHRWRRGQGNVEPNSRGTAQVDPNRNWRGGPLPQTEPFQRHRPELTQPGLQPRTPDRERRDRYFQRRSDLSEEFTDAVI